MQPFISTGANLPFRQGMYFSPKSEFSKDTRVYVCVLHGCMQFRRRYIRKLKRGPRRRLFASRTCPSRVFIAGTAAIIAKSHALLVLRSV